MDKITDEQIEKAKQAVINNLKQKDLSLGQETGKYWGEILDGDYEFDNKEKRIAALEKMTRE